MKDKKVDIAKLEKKLARLEKTEKINNVLFYLIVVLAGLILLIDRTEIVKSIGFIGFALIYKFIFYPQMIGKLKTQINEYYAENPEEKAETEEIEE